MLTSANIVYYLIKGSYDGEHKPISKRGIDVWGKIYDAAVSRKMSLSALTRDLANRQAREKLYDEFVITAAEVLKESS